MRDRFGNLATIRFNGIKT